MMTTLLVRTKDLLSKRQFRFHGPGVARFIVGMFLAEFVLFSVFVYQAVYRIRVPVGLSVCRRNTSVYELE